MPEFYTRVILLINQSEELCEKQLSDLASKWAKIALNAHTPLLKLPYTLPLALFQVPRVFINGRFIGGGDETQAAESSGQLVRWLKE